MDYKKLIPDQKTRFKILKFMDFVPDKQMIKLQYRIATGRKLDFKNLNRFTEKLQWYKLYHRDPLMTQCADKYGVREYIYSKGYGDILVPLYGVYDKVEDIDFDKLPDRFVLKTTNGSHTNIYCESKSTFNIEVTREKLNEYMNSWSSKVGREWSYYDIKPRIICEKYIEKDENNDLIDYKFLCFNGEPFCLYVVVGRYSEYGMQEGIYNLNFEKMPYGDPDMIELKTEVKKPKNFEQMVKIAREFSKDFPHVRVDLYNVNGKILFGELTFYDGSGYMAFTPDDFDFILGEKFKLPIKIH